MNELKKEFASYCWGISKTNNKWDYWWELLENSNNKILFKNKMVKLLELLNSNETEILDKDIENDIYDIL